MVSIPGVDYPWSHPGGAALKAAGMQFACRYLSHDPSKNITRAEADDLAAHGVASVVVWESTANRALSGRAGGIADATTAAAQAKAAGMPDGRPIYFAVDFDATAAQQAAINNYLDGTASVLGESRVGIYGGYYPVKRALDGGHAAWAWQTAAWSGGQWDSRAVIRQPATTVRINGVTCDVDTATVADYGQWTPGHTPAPAPHLEDDVAITDADALKIAAAVAGFKNPKLDVTPNKDIRQRIVDAGTYAKEAADGVKTLGGKVGTAVLTDAQVTTIADRLAANPAFAQTLAAALGKDLAARLQS